MPIRRRDHLPDGLVAGDGGQRYPMRMGSGDGAQRHAIGGRNLRCRIGVGKFPPVVRAVLGRRHEERTEPVAPAVEDERRRSLLRLGVTREDRLRDIVRLLVLVGEEQARPKPDEVEHIGQACRLVEVVDVPDQPGLGVEPEAEVARMRITDRRRGRGAHQVRTEDRCALRPPPAGGAQEEEGVFRHALVLLPERILVHICPEAGPQGCLVAGDRGDEIVHGPHPEKGMVRPGWRA